MMKQNVPEDKVNWLDQARLSDNYWIKNIYQVKELDGGDLEVEGNYHRYLPAKNILIRVSSNATIEEFIRVTHSALLSGAKFRLSIDSGFTKSTGVELGALVNRLNEEGRDVRFESEEEFNPNIRPGTRLILIGARDEKTSQLQANPDLFVIAGKATKSGRATLLAFYREQSISITQHRFGAISAELVNIFKPLG
ncbi:MAG: hypothetical protein F2662_04645 [Actinobacteria bacterium]|uniref:Unannotated protein n=1 Tax=freshwater metagenome TaxID=449393 RepID=A0A6J6NYU7_9ZZZZ|nr:hypothetical protein [Actinomycetota bacterium]